jgi:hypothetical protein
LPTDGTICCQASRLYRLRCLLPYDVLLLRATVPGAHEIALPKSWAERAVLVLLVAAQALERVEPPPSLAVPVTLAGTLAFGAGLTVGWILWGL